MNIFLCGMPGAGKTYYGKKLAERLQWEFIDIDQWIEAECGQSCRDFVLQRGATAFRAIEKRILKAVAVKTKCVIATGGGIILDQENREVMVKYGTSIYLKSDGVDLLARLQKKLAVPSYIDPARAEASFYDLLQERLPYYETCAVTVDVTGLRDEEVVEKILNLEGSQIDSVC